MCYRTYTLKQYLLGGKYMESKKFKNHQEAKEFAKEVGGFVEGPFIDEKLYVEWFVFYKEEK